MAAPRKIERFTGGTPSARDKLNRLVEEVNRASSGAHPVRQVMTHGSRVPVRFKRFRVKEVLGDYLRCRPFNGNAEEAQDFLVAKPPLLQRTPFDGLERGGIGYVYTSNEERTATKTADSNTETQIVIPGYMVDDILIAVTPIEGGTGVTVNGKAVVWMDTSARMWAKKAS